MRIITKVEEVQGLRPLAVILIGVNDLTQPGVLAAQRDSGDVWFVPADPDGKSSEEMVRDIENAGLTFSAAVAYEGVTPAEVAQLNALIAAANGR
jgi:hypothetical protein